MQQAWKQTIKPPEGEILQKKKKWSWKLRSVNLLNNGFWHKDFAAKTGKWQNMVSS